MGKKPIKRHESLQPFSREHHFGLLLSWKIRQGFAKNVSLDRMKSYIEWFWKTHLQTHFEKEEEVLFPVLGENHELIQQALKEHKELIQLFNSKDDLEDTLHQIAEKISAHIRFEERVLFNKIQEVATKEELRKIDAIHDEFQIKDNWEDEFWL